MRVVDGPFERRHEGGLDQEVHVTAPDGQHASLRRLVFDLVEEIRSRGPLYRSRIGYVATSHAAALSPAVVRAALTRWEALRRDPRPVAARAAAVAAYDTTADIPPHARPQAAE